MVGLPGVGRGLGDVPCAAMGTVRGAGPRQAEDAGGRRPPGAGRLEPPRCV